MNTREVEKLRVLIRGRKRRRDAGVPRTPQGWARLLNPQPEPAYRRVSYREAKLFARLRAKGRSLRWIGRRHGRSHHTVARWLLRARAVCGP